MRHGWQQQKRQPQQPPHGDFGPSSQPTTTSDSPPVSNSTWRSPCCTKCKRRRASNAIESFTINVPPEDRGLTNEVNRNARPMSRITPTIPASATAEVNSVVRLLAIGVSDMPA